MSICQAKDVIAQETCLIHGKNCIHYSIKQDIKCLECLINEPLKNLMLITKDSIINSQKDLLVYSDSLMVVLDNELIISQNNFVKMKKKRNSAFIIGGISSFVVFILTLISIK